MSTWIESHVSLRAHPKTARLAKELGVSVATAVGHLHCLWWWAIEYAQDGRILATYDAVDVANGAAWEGEPEAFIDALRASRFLDEDALHDWSNYAGRLLERRRQDAERKRAARSSAGRPEDGVGTSKPRGSGRPKDGARTEPTEPTEPPRPLAAKRGSRKPDPIFEALVSVMGWSLDGLTTAERGKLNAAAKQLRGVGATPEEIVQRAGTYRRKHPDWECTPNAIASHWSDLDGGKATGETSDKRDQVLAIVTTFLGDQAEHVVAKITDRFPLEGNALDSLVDFCWRHRAEYGAEGDEDAYMRWNGSRYDDLQA